MNLLLIAAAVFAFALLLWAFAVFAWQFLEERTRGWLRMLLVVVLASSCALAAALATILITSAVITALRPHERPARIEPEEPETTSENTEPSAHQRDGDALPFALGVLLCDVLPLGLRPTLGHSFTLGPGHKNAASVVVRGSGPPLRPNPLDAWEVAPSRRCALRLVRESSRLFFLVFDDLL